MSPRYDVGASVSVLTIALALTGCGGLDEGSGTMAAGGASASGGAASSGGSSGSGGVVTGGAFDHCGDATPDSTCSRESTCLEAACGFFASDLDEEGCVRARCSSDADCAEDELCFPAPAVVQVDALSPRFSVSCRPSSDGRCACTGVDVRDGAGAYCLARNRVLGEWGCGSSVALTADCSAFAAWIAAAQALLDELLLYPTVQTRAEQCITIAQERFAETCP